MSFLFIFPIFNTPHFFVQIQFLSGIILFLPEELPLSFLIVRSADYGFPQLLFVAPSAFSHPCTPATQRGFFSMLSPLSLWQPAGACYLMLY